MKIKLRDATYFYKSFGKGDPIVLLHGFTGSSSSWKRVVEELTSQYQVITIDLPGHGKTSVDFPRTIEACCDDLQAVFKHLGLKSFHLVGYSMGGRVALTYTLMDPTSVKTLILESSSPGLHLPSERMKRRKSDAILIKKIKVEGLTAFIDFWENIPLFKTQKQLPLSLQGKVRKVRRSQTEEGLIQSLRYMGTGVQPSWWPYLSTIQSPTLLIVGTLDEKFVIINEQMVKKIPDATLKYIEQVGHTVHLEAPSIYCEHLMHFFEKHPL